MDVPNLDTEDHTFHMHQTEFLVTATSGKPPVTGEAIQDAIELPHAVGGKPGEIEAIIPFLNPADTAGEFAGAEPLRENLLASWQQTGQKQDIGPALFNHNA